MSLDKRSIQTLTSIRGIATVVTDSISPIHRANFELCTSTFGSVVRGTTPAYEWNCP
jgi:hypothetical protein